MGWTTFDQKVLLYKKAGRSLEVGSLEDAKRVGRIGTYKDDSKEQLLRKLGFKNLDSAPDDLANPKKPVTGRMTFLGTTSIQEGPAYFSKRCAKSGRTFPPSFVMASANGFNREKG